MYLKVFKDFEHSESAGAGGMFQIGSIEDGDENDLNDKVNLGIHFHDEEHLKRYLSETFKVPVEEIDLDIDTFEE